jgi:hypothetical protein
MADFTLYDGDNGENRVSFLPTLEKERLIDLLMYLCPNKKDINDTIEFHLTFKYEDVVLLKDYLSSVITIFDKQSVSTR